MTRPSKRIFFFIFTLGFLPAVSMALDGSEHIGNVVSVATEGGDFRSVLDAIASIEDSSKSNPYIIKIGPGEYDLGAKQLYLKEYVSIVGSGVGSTVLKTQVFGDSLSQGAAIVGAEHARLSQLSIEHVSAGSYAVTILNLSSLGVYNIAIAHNSFSSNAYGIYNAWGTLPSISATSIILQSIAEGTGLMNYGVNTIANDLSINVTAQTGYAVRINGGNPVMDNVFAKATSLDTTGVIATLKIEDTYTECFIKNSSFDTTGGEATNPVAIFIGAGATGARIVNSRVIGNIEDQAASEQCLGLYNSILWGIGC